MDLHHLLQRLNAPPFSLGLTIIAFRCQPRRAGND
jgi:hypothetical protein